MKLLLLLVFVIVSESVSISHSDQDLTYVDVTAPWTYQIAWCEVDYDSPDASECTEPQGPKACVRERIGGGVPQNAETYCESFPRLMDKDSCLMSGCCHWNDWEAGEGSNNGKGRCWSNIGSQQCTNTNQMLYRVKKKCVIRRNGLSGSAIGNAKSWCQGYSGGRFVSNPSCGHRFCSHSKWSSHMGSYQRLPKSKYNSVQKCSDWEAQGRIMKKVGCIDLQKHAGTSLGRCILNAAIGALPVIGDMYTLMGLLANDCGQCKGTDGCAKASGTAIANKVRDDTAKKSAEKMATKAGMTAAKWGARYAGPAGMGIAFGLGLADCLMKEFLGFSIADLGCMAPSTNLLTSDGSSKSLKEAVRGDHFQIYSSGDIQEDKTNASAFRVVAGEKANGRMHGWAAKYPDWKSVDYKELTTKGGRKIRVTPDHFLWVRPNKLSFAKDVKVHDELPYFSKDGGTMKWDPVTAIVDVTETGLYSPFILGDHAKDVGDMVLTNHGLVVPIYAGGKSFSGLNPKADHAIFKGWARGLEGFEKKYPCLFEETTGGTRIIKLMEFFSELQDEAVAHKNATPEEMNPEAFIAALKKEAPRSIALQSVIGECPKFAKDLALEHLEYVHFIEKERAIIHGTKEGL